MIDLSAVSISNQPSRFLVGIPFSLLVVLALPILLLLAPLVLVASLAVRVSPFEVFPALWRLLTALRGTHVEVAGSRRSVLLHIS
jgi:hypothetical protein